MKTASHILGTAFFLEGYEVQDAPRYGAERRGAPIFAYVRAARSPVNERGIITHPDLVIVADDTLVGMPAAGVMQGVDQHTTLLINTHESEATWQDRLNSQATIMVLPAQEEVEDRADLPYIGSRCAAAAAALTGVIHKDKLLEAIREELGHLGEAVVSKNLNTAETAFDAMQAQHGVVKEGEPFSAADYRNPEWIELPFESADISAPAIHAGATSTEVHTGLWRTMRPVIDYDHCKGCLVCVGVCPPHAIAGIPEFLAQQGENDGKTGGAADGAQTADR